MCYDTDEDYIVTLCGHPGTEKFRETLRHELTRYLVAAYFCDIPPWIDEGLSEVMSSGPPFPIAKATCWTRHSVKRGGEEKKRACDSCVSRPARN